MKYRVWMHSRPGMWTFYEGKVDVFAENDEQAVVRALEDLRRGTFKDRPSRDSWVIERVERLQGGYHDTGSEGYGECLCSDTV